MAKTAKHHAKHLPTKPPKRTGKRMPPPEDPDEQTIAEVMAGEAPKQKRLPTMEDPAIEELEAAAKDYASKRDARMRLLEAEVALKDQLLSLMQGHGKETYKHDGVEIRVVREAAKVKVKVTDEED